MSEAKFTKGPWVVYDDVVSVSFYGMESRPGIESDDGKTIVVFGCDTHDEYDCSGVHGETKDQVKANAHLIAAAPAMYGEIQRDIRWLRILKSTFAPSSTEYRAIQSRIEDKIQLLAKARGEHE